MKSLNAEEIYPEHQLFSGEGETSTERGTAYHRFLELCDFSINSRDGVKDELENLIHVGKITQEQADLLEAEQLCKILSMPVFSDLHGAKLYREREFLCRLKANEILPTPAEDYILVQGAIDLFADFGGRIKIIDYKFSHKSLEMLKSAYSAQLALYKRAASVITGVAPENIRTVIVNIFTCAQTEL